jgi:hypothetical protein
VEVSPSHTILPVGMGDGTTTCKHWEQEIPSRGMPSLRVAKEKFRSLSNASADGVQRLVVFEKER